MTSAAAISDIDPFSDTVLADPFPAHAALRDAGPVVRLSRYGIYAVARHAEVHAVLSDWGNYCSSRGVGLDTAGGAVIAPVREHRMHLRMPRHGVDAVARKSHHRTRITQRRMCRERIGQYR